MKLCVALDMASKDECLNLARELKGLDLWLKVGMRAFYREGFAFIEELKKIYDFKIFLDLKLYDIPNTMADACEELAKFEIQMINLHASAGKIALQTCMQRLNSLKSRPLVLGVSALTSFDEQGFFEIYKQNLKEAVENLSKICFESSLDGMVCSVFESKLIKNATNQNFLTLTPGIRPFKEESNDQKRVADITMAKQENADFIVVGRPIYKDKDPRKKCERILNEL